MRLKVKQISNGILTFIVDIWSNGSRRKLNIYQTIQIFLIIDDMKLSFTADVIDFKVEQTQQYFFSNFILNGCRYDRHGNCSLYGIIRNQLDM